MFIKSTNTYCAKCWGRKPEEIDKNSSVCAAGPCVGGHRFRRDPWSLYVWQLGSEHARASCVPSTGLSVLSCLCTPVCSGPRGGPGPF